MVRNILVSLLVPLILASLCGALAGCNTLEGAGKDIERAGKAIKEEAKELKSKM
jgi:entericidin B